MASEAAKHAEVARANTTQAGLAGIVELHLGKALDVLPQLAAGAWNTAASVSKN